MSNLIGIQIIALTPTPSISDSTCIPIQRVGVTKAEKLTIETLLNYFLTSSNVNEKIITSVSREIGNHISEIDPHGDRIYANAILTDHVQSNDPHNSRKYTDDTIATKFNNHNSETNPHGINDKISNAINTHLSEEDPHGDKAFTLSEITKHQEEADAHGSKAYTDAKAAESVLQSKTYTDTSFTQKVGVTVAPLVNSKIPSQYLPTVVEKVYTTDDIAEGTNTSRKYLTEALKTKYDAKVNTVAMISTSNPESTILHSVTDTKDVKLKNIISDSSILLKDNLDSIVITDNTYKYEGTTTDEEVELELAEIYKKTELEDLSENAFYKITGEVDAVEYTIDDGKQYTIDNETIAFKYNLGYKVNVSSVEKPSNIVITDDGLRISGNALANKKVVVYDSNFTEIITTNVLSSGTFNTVLTTNINTGEPIYLYTVDNTYQSTALKVVTKNSGTLKNISALSLSKDGLKLRGSVEKDCTITLKKGETALGTGTTDDNGNFEITLTSAVSDNEVISITATNSLTKTVTQDYTVYIPSITVPYNIVVSEDRKTVTGSCEANSSLTVTIGTAITKEVGESGIFTIDLKDTTGLSTATSMTSTVVKEGTAESVSYVLNKFINTALKPQEKLKVDKVGFRVITSKNTKDFGKDKFNFDVRVVDTDVKLFGKNTSNALTKWVAKLKIEKIIIN